MTVVDDDPSEQLQQDLLRSVKDALLTSRPILTHLNADTTWLLQVPCPENVELPTGRSRYNILLDPWLKGPQTDVGSWLSKQWHMIKSCVEDFAELETHLADIEILTQQARKELISRTKRRKKAQKESGVHDKPEFSYIDAVVISHEFSDHCHQATLMELKPTVPVFASIKAASLIRSWGHFHTVIDLPVFDGMNWHTFSISPLPSWLGVARITTPSNTLYYHAAVSIFIADSDSPSASAEAVIYSPHGIQAETLSSLSSASPRVQPLALLHGLHDISISNTAQLNLGAHNALKAQRILGTKYWVGTHDEVKKGTGIVAPLLKRKQITLAEALKAEGTESAEKVNFADLSSGESLLLL